MSSHYSVLLSLPLSVSSAVEHCSVLEFIFNEQGLQPDHFPDHSFFENFNPEFRFHNSYRNMVSGSWKSAYWLEQDASGKVFKAGVNLTLPGKKLEEVWQDTLPLVHWLASISTAQGAVGIVVAEDTDDDKPMVLFVRDSRLFISASQHEDLYDFDDAF
ncbi:hypothetical protein [Oceanimonas baumannii]|uniref:Uncharacterized protein n=1 Tax=Oceanimonas baumannii TaxID=129578 RepID=A0A235C971_9GAMM|nr:hypothetical protein [Oceanimonas baumannii]OYD21012.1 hypothetical protein B6S09_17925 [Oceanimonas baumannii]TDW56413.1 hypothetical protein LY04_03039 [Oceanimonas baumannii]